MTVIFENSGGNSRHSIYSYEETGENGYPQTVISFEIAKDGSDMTIIDQQRPLNPYESLSLGRFILKLHNDYHANGGRDNYGE